MSKLFLLFGSLSAGLAVILGAFGAHGLRGKLPVNLLSAFETGVQYQMYHALALMIVGVLVQIYPTSNLLKWSGALFILGSLLFSGSLYGLVLTQIKLFGPVTPLGGVAFIAGWLLLAYALFKSA
ncbi:MAG: DUF423 domain-containing protein [Pseudomonadales bacterium]|nr:DUF423 domain-containing protein [Pseudomonadales bacterium]MCP5216290.1 DUF423 domain-containing protein [Pseudomonadales bacterium]